MTVLLINMRQIKTHYSKVIGNEIIVRQVIELGVKTKLEEGQGVCASCSWHLLAGTECGGSAVKTRCCDTPDQPVRPGAGRRQDAGPMSKWVVSVRVVTEAGRSLGRRT